MAIRRLKVSNFRSFNELDIELGDFNVLIGANASGKSNFIEVFRFLRDIRKDGLRNAVALQGGSRYIQNLRLGTTKPLSIEITDDQETGYRALWTDKEDKCIFIHVHDLTYGFSLNALADKGHLHRDGWHIQRDRVAGKLSIDALTEMDGKLVVESEKLTEGEFLAWWDNDELKRVLDIDTCIKDRFALEENFVTLDPVWFPRDALLLESNSFPIRLSGAPIPPFSALSEVGIYRIEVGASQQARPVRVLASLTETAANLAPILDRIFADEAQRRMLMSLVRFLLPFIDDLDVQRLIDDSLLLHVTESYTEKKKLHAGLLSDGTIAAISLVVALYFEFVLMVIFEDPDRGLHPKLMARVVEMMKEVSKEKQIIITTHHPEMVRYAGVENLLLVSRDEDGFSQISRPADKTMVKQFLANDIGLDQLYVDDLLEV